MIHRGHETNASRRHSSRGSPPAHLPRIEQVVDIEDRICPCCAGSVRTSPSVWMLVAAQLRVLVVRRLKYACRARHEVVVQASAPARLIEGGLGYELERDQRSGKMSAGQLQLA